MDIFCKIVAGEIPCYKLYEDEHLLAFLDIGPLAEGHCLIVPKRHYERLDEMTDGPGQDALAAIARLAPRLGKAVCQAVGATDWNLLQNNGLKAGQVVPHVHFHIIPRREGDGLGFRWPAGSLDGEQAKRLAATIGAELG
jgi:histidine triad (HIT) family protein